jgi:hypothetical protein
MNPGTDLEPSPTFRPHLDTFATSLCESGYSAHSIRRHLRAAAHLCHWAERQGLLVDLFDERALKRFKVHLSKCKCPRKRVESMIPDRESRDRASRAYISDIAGTATLQNARDSEYRALHAASRRRRHAARPARAIPQIVATSPREPRCAPRFVVLVTTIVKGRLALGFGAEVVLAVAITSWFGCIPLLVWGATLTAPLRHTASPLAIGIAILTALVAPAAIAVLVLRWRDPESHIEWDEREIREHRGALVRCAIPVARASAALHELSIAGRRVARTVRALQIFDDVSGEVITAWEHAPPNVVVRRRLCADRIEPLRAALAELQVPFDRALDITRAQEPDRVRIAWRVAVGRLGYALAILAAALAPSQHVAGIALGVGGAVLLGLRASTSMRELRALTRPLPDAAPYRAASPSVIAVGDLKRGAVIAEVTIRLLVMCLAIGCPLLALR